MSFWVGKRVLLTGGTGFLGSHIASRLENCGVRKLFIPRSRDYNLTDERATRKLFREVKPDITIHCASVVGGIGINQAEPGRFFRENVLMGVNVLHEAWQAGVSKLVSIGTICAYPKHTPAPFREEDLWNGYPEETNAPYGLAKKMLLVQAQAYRKQYGFISTFLMPVNLYGPKDNFDPKSSHVIPALIRKCLVAIRDKSDMIEVWGTGTATREFLYVDDCAEAIVKSAELYDGEDPVNIGSGMEISIKDLVATIAKLTGFCGKIVWNKSKPDGQPRRLLDTSRAKRYFDWQATTPFLVGLEREIEWAREHVAL